MAQRARSYFTARKNPFVTRGDPLSSEDVALIFTVPQSLFRCVQVPFHHHIEGDLGSGKTTLLRAMSSFVRAAVERHRPTLAERIYDRPYFGLYVSFSSEYASIFRVDEHSKVITKLFISWLNVRIAQELFGSLALYLKDMWIGAAEHSKADVRATLAGSLRFPSNAPIEWANPELVSSSLDRIANALRMSIDVDGQISLPDGYGFLKNAVEAPIAPEQCLSMLLESLCSNITDVEKFLPVFLLLDCCEELSESLQMVINGLFSWRTHQLFFTKACSLPGGIVTNSTLSGRQIRRPDEVQEKEIKWDWTSEEYRSFCRMVASRHLTRFSDLHPEANVAVSLDDILQELDPLDELNDILGGAVIQKPNALAGGTQPSGVNGATWVRKTLFHEIHKRGGEKRYSGFREFTALSSGNIRTFIRLCESAWDKETEIKANDAHTLISPFSQDKAARRVAEEWLRSRIMTTTSVYEGEVRHFVNSFCTMLRERYRDDPQSCVWPDLRVTSKDGKTIVFSGELEEAIHSAFSAGIMRSVGTDDSSQTFRVVPVFAPHWQLNPELEGTVDVDVQTIDRMFTVFRRKAANTKATELEGLRLFDMKLEAPRVFLAMPDKVKKVVSSAERIVRKVVKDGYGGELVTMEMSDAEMLPDAIKELIQERVSIMFVDVTRRCPNIKFKYGIGIASQLPVYSIYNTAFRKFSPSVLPDVLQGVRVIKYSSRGGARTLEKEVRAKLGKWRDSITSEKRCVVRPKCPFPKVEYRDAVLALGPETEEWRGEIVSAIQKALGGKLPVEMSPKRTQPSIPVLCTRCNMIRQCRFVLIDTSFNEESMALLLGMAFAFDKEPVLLRRGGQQWEPSCWQGKPSIPFITPDELVEGLDKKIDWST